MEKIIIIGHPNTRIEHILKCYDNKIDVINIDTKNNLIDATQEKINLYPNRLIPEMPFIDPKEPVFNYHKHKITGTKKRKLRKKRKHSKKRKI